MKILFLCVANSARSQLAEGLAKQILGTDTVVRSAGSVPGGKVNPYAVAVLKEIGIDISKNHSKAIEELEPEFLAGLDYSVTLCAEEVCPLILSKAKKLHWGLADPAGHPGDESEQLKRFRHTRDQIQSLLEAFAKQL